MMKSDTLRNSAPGDLDAVYATDSTDVPVSHDSLPSRGAGMLPPRLVRYLVPCFCALIVFSTYQSTGRLSEGRVIGAWIATAVFLAAFPVAARFPGLAQAGDRINAVLIVIIGASGLALQLVAPQAAPFAVVITAVVMAGFRLHDGPGRIVAGLMSAVYITVVVLTQHIGPAAVVAICMGLVFGYIAAASVRNLRQEQLKTESLLTEVLSGREAQVRAAKLDERARLAREIHDVLAHTLSALSIQLEGARMLVAQRPADPAALQAIERSSNLAREGLNEARRAVGSLRGDDAPDLRNLPGLVEDFERDTGVPSVMRVEGTETEPPPEARLALYRVVQEALTNVRRHADATRVDVSLQYNFHTVVVVIENEGAPRPSPSESGGYGLTGMRERAALIGGTLEAGPTPTGFRVRLSVPA